MEGRAGLTGAGRPAPSESDAERAALFTGLVTSDSLDELTRGCVAAAHSLVSSTAVSFDVIDTAGGAGQTLASTGVSAYFLRRYEQIGRRADPVYEEAIASRRPVDNDTLMPTSDWASLPIYESVFKLHRLARVLCAPIVVGGDVVATLNVGRHEDDPPFCREELEVVRSLSEAIGATYASLTERHELRREHAILSGAIDLCDVPVVVTDALSGSRHLNTSARRLFAAIEDAGLELDDLLSDPRKSQATIALDDGTRAQLHCASAPLERYPDVVVSFPRLVADDDTVRLAPVLEALLTVRERDVAVLAAQGLRDAEIASRLALSEHTIKQHLKGAYRKLGVRSRVELTLLVLGR